MSKKKEPGALSYLETVAMQGIRRTMLERTSLLDQAFSSYEIRFPGLSVHAQSSALGSLVKKGLVRSTYDDILRERVFELTTSGREAMKKVPEEPLAEKTLELEVMATPASRLLRPLVALHHTTKKGCRTIVVEAWKPVSQSYNSREGLTEARFSVDRTCYVQFETVPVFLSGARSRAEALAWAFGVEVISSPPRFRDLAGDPGLASELAALAGALSGARLPECSGEMSWKK